MKNKPKKIIWVVVVFLIIILSLEYLRVTSLNKTVVDAENLTDKYIENNGCDSNMSDNSYTECGIKALVKIQAEKQQYFNKIEELMKKYPNNSFLAGEPQKYKDFQNWYKFSDNYNHSRCEADYYSILDGSSHDSSVVYCQISEAQRDIQLLSDTYKGLISSSLIY